MECMAQFVRIDDGEESPFAIPWGTHTRDVGCQVAPVLDKPLEPPFEIGEPLQNFGLQCLNREQRNEADHGANLHRLALASRQVQHVVERSEEHTSELQSPCNLVCRLLLEKKTE